MQLFQDVGEGRKVEHVLEALAVGLEDHREAGEIARHFEQGLGLQPLLPERRAFAGVGAWDQERARGVLAEAGAEQRRAGELADDQVLQLGRVDQHQVGGRRLVGVGEVDDDAVVGPDRVGLEVALVADFARQREAPGGVHAAAVRGEDAEAPVADLVAEALHHDRLVGGDDAGRVLLFAQVGDEVVGGAGVEVVVLGELGRLAVDRLAGEGADRLAELGRPADPVAAPERHRAGGAGGGRDDHPVAGDFFDPPAARAEQEGLARARLVDHLLVELADPPAVRQVDAVEAAVGDRPGVGDDQLARAFAAVDRALQAVPDDPRAQLGEAVGGIAAVEHVEHVLQLLAGEVVEGLGRDDDLLHVVDLPLVERRHRDQVLGEHVERVLRDLRLLDLPFAHPPRDHRALEQVAAVFGEDPAFGGLADAVPGAADPLQAAGHRLRRLDLDHEVDGAHVDAELQRGGGDEAGQLARLQHLLDQRPLLVGERAVVGAGDLDLLQRLAGVGVAGAGRLLVAARARSPAAPLRLRRWRARSAVWRGARRRGGC